MATATGSTFWSNCTAAGCSGSYLGQPGRRCSTALHASAPICGQCAKAGKVARLTSDVAFDGTDRQEGRKAAASVQLPKVSKGTHKALQTEGGRLRGGLPEAVTKAVQAKLPKAAPKAAPKVAAPKAAPKRQRKRPAAKTA